MSAVLSYIGLGSNLADPVMQVRQAISAIATLPSSKLQAQSPLYISKPMGPSDQPDYINAVVALETTLTPLELLDAMQSIEQVQGRVREGQRWGPRTLDLDILLYGQEVINQLRLQVPHPGLTERSFVLYPLASIAPELVIPNHGSLRDLLANCPDDGLERLD